MKSRIIGVHRVTRDEIQMTIESRDQSEAEGWATNNAIAWTSIAPQPPPLPSKMPPSQNAIPYRVMKDRVIWLIGVVVVLAWHIVSYEQPKPTGLLNPDAPLNMLGYRLGNLIVILAIVLVPGLIGAVCGGKEPGAARIGFTIGALSLSVPAMVSHLMQ